jgi:carbamoyl-phosphate synthase small subunit
MCVWVHAYVNANVCVCARVLCKLDCKVTVVPFDFEFAARALDSKCQGSAKVDGVVLSNGPGDPAQNTAIVEQVAALLHAGQHLGQTVPILGICLGHQLLAIASGAVAYKMVRRGLCECVMYGM